MAALRGKYPDEASPAFWHAAALSALHRSEDAIAALERAVQLGSVETWRLKNDTWFAALREDPRYPPLLERVEANSKAAEARMQAADALLPAAEAPAFASAKLLLAAFEKEERGLHRSIFRPYREREVADRALRARKIAALERYVGEHPESADREEAAQSLLRTHLDRMGWTLPWREALGADLRRASAAHRESFPAGDGAREARLYELAARAFSAPGEIEQDILGSPRAAECRSALDDLAAFAAETPEDAWTGRAHAIRAMCLHLSDPADAEAFRKARAEYDARTEQASGHSLLNGVDRLLKVAALRVDGPPDFSVKDQEGREVTLASLRGKVVLMNFWSPG